MTVPFWCLLGVILINYVLSGIGGRLKSLEFGSIDLRNPRTQSAALPGESAGARAVAAQANGWEAVSVFGSAVFVAHLAGADPGTSATLAVVVVVARIAHALFYIADFAPLRVLSFAVGLFSCLGLFGLAAVA